MKPITNIYVCLEIDSGNAAFTESLEGAKSEVSRLFDKAKQEALDNIDPDSIYNGTEVGLPDINGNACGTVCITTEVDEDVIDDETEWCDKLRDLIKDVGFRCEGTSIRFYDLDAAYEHDPIGVKEWFSNHTDAAITAGEVVPEASGWEFS